MKGVLWALTAVLTGLALFEISMQPSWSERFELAQIFLLMALAMWAAARWLPSLARRNRSIRMTVALLSLAAFSIVVAGALAIGGRMFLSSHDLTLLLVVIAFGVVAAVGFTLSVSRELSKDLDRLSESATKVAGGVFDGQLLLDRRDELGRLSRALESMVAQLEEAEAERRSDARSRQEFFASVGHDLRTPLASIQAAVEAIKDGVAADPHAYLGTIETDVAKLAGLVDDIYLLARIDSGTASFANDVIDVTEIADESVEILRPIAATRGIEIRLEAPGRFIASGDRESVGRTLRNIIENAVRHSPNGGEVTVSLRSDSGTTTVGVADSGPGFDDAFIPVAFDRFSRPESSRGRETGGSGLGLAIARSLVESMGGEIWIVPGRHGEVGFSLPDFAEAASGPVRPEPPGRGDLRRRTSSHRQASTRPDRA